MLVARKVHNYTVVPILVEAFVEIISKKYRIFVNTFFMIEIMYRDAVFYEVAKILTPHLVLSRILNGRPLKFAEV